MAYRTRPYDLHASRPFSSMGNKRGNSNGAVTLWGAKPLTTNMMIPIDKIGDFAHSDGDRGSNPQV